MRLYTNGTDFVIAEDIDDAWLAWSEHSGESREDYDDGDMRWTEYPPGKNLSVWCDSDGDVCEIDEDGGEQVERDAAGWIKKEGRGFLCSTEH